MSSSVPVCTRAQTASVWVQEGLEALSVGGLYLGQMIYSFYFSMIKIQKSTKKENFHTVCWLASETCHCVV